jgi:hypothetical protein
MTQTSKYVRSFDILSEDKKTGIIQKGTGYRDYDDLLMKDEEIMV